MKAAGILMIIDACLTFFIALIFSIEGIGVLYLTSFGGIYLLTIGVLGIIAFSVGLASAISVLRSKRFAFSLLGTSLMLTVGILVSITPFAALFYGAPIVMFAVISIVLLATSRKEFS